MNEKKDLRLQHTRLWNKRTRRHLLFLCFLYFQFEQKSNENNTEESGLTGGWRIEFLMGHGCRVKS